ncbi:MAG: hypothetical protein JNK05_16800 [Myxococcales bacterium]|nr:hypothetical protein [Myxococcales bacterium]
MHERREARGLRRFALGSALLALSSCAPSWHRPWTQSITRADVGPCAYTVRPIATTPVTGALSDRVAREWLSVSARRTASRCPVQLARVQPEWTQEALIPSLDELRAFVRARTTARVRDYDDEPYSSDTLFDWQQLLATLDGAQLRAHFVARALARSGINVHKLFAIGPLVLRRGENTHYHAPSPSWSNEDTFRLLYRWQGTSLDDGVQPWLDLEFERPGPPIPRMVVYRPAPVVVVRALASNADTFACPDASERRCELRVIDPALRPTILDRRTDEEFGLLTVSQWLHRMRPTNDGPDMGVSLELARRTQMLPASLHGRGGPSIVELADDHPCEISPDTLRAHHLIEGVRRPGFMTFRQRRVFSAHRIRFQTFPGTPEQDGGIVVVEGVDEPFLVRASAIESFEHAARDGRRIAVNNGERGMEAFSERNASSSRLACDLSSVAASWMRDWPGPWVR